MNIEKNVFQKITPNRSAIALKLIENEKIVKLLHYLKDDKPIEDIAMPEDVYEIYKKKIFKRTNVDHLVEVEDCFIMLGFPIISPHKNQSNTYSAIKLVFNVMCHKNIIDTYEGDRIDEIVSELFNMYVGSTEFGFELKSPTVKEYSHKDYYMVSVEFDITEFTQNR